MKNMLPFVKKISKEMDVLELILKYENVFEDYIKYS
jgi:hypothetical protein